MGKTMLLSLKSTPGTGPVPMQHQKQSAQLDGPQWCPFAPLYSCFVVDGRISTRRYLYKYRVRWLPLQWGISPASSTSAAAPSSSATASSAPHASTSTTVAPMVSSPMHATSSAAAIRLVLGLLFLYDVDDLVRHSKVLYLDTC
jgi:hypothetical protein